MIGTVVAQISHTIAVCIGLVCVGNQIAVITGRKVAVAFVLFVAGASPLVDDSVVVSVVIAGVSDPVSVSIFLARIGVPHTVVLTTLLSTLQCNMSVSHILYSGWEVYKKLKVKQKKAAKWCFKPNFKVVLS